MKLRHALVIILVVLFSCSPGKAPAETRPSCLAGTWYPADARKLAVEVDALLRQSRTGPLKDPLVLIVPHAGYAYSGPTAAAAYQSVKGMKPGVIVILGTAHHVPVRGCALAVNDFFETPLGRVPVRLDIVRRLLNEGLFSDNREAHADEHSVEIQLPLLQRVFAAEIAHGAGIVPALIGEVDGREAGLIARSLANALAGEKNPLVIVSTDFTHYGRRFGYTPFRAADKADARAKLKKLDYGAIEYILKKDVSGFSRYVDETGITICGAGAVKAALTLPIDGFKSGVIDYRTSIDSTGDYDSTVSYASIALCGKLAGIAARADVKWDLPVPDRILLLDAARRNIASVLDDKGELKMDPSKLPATCLAKRGAFVTLKKNGALRGCIGFIAAEKPLYRTVLENALNAALSDPRFVPVKKDELDGISIEISVLTEPVEVASPGEIVPGRDGLIIERGPYRGLLLPQVAVEYGWDRDTFLDNTCVKAGLNPGAWREKGTRIYRFEAIVFGEQINP